jgi:hypothetical protein
LKENTGEAYIDGVLVWSHLAAAAAELQKRDECKWQLKRQYHLQGIQSKENNYKNRIISMWSLNGWYRRHTLQT